MKASERASGEGWWGGRSEPARVSSCTVILEPLYFCRSTLQRREDLPVARAFVDKLIFNGTVGDFLAKAEENGDRPTGVRTRARARRETTPGSRCKNKSVGRPPETSFPLFLFFFRDSQAPCQAARRLSNLPVKRPSPTTSAPL